MTIPLALTIEQDFPVYAPYPLISPLVGFADDTNLTIAHTPQEPQTPDAGPTVTQQPNNLVDVTISYLSRNNLIVQPTTSVAMIKGSATAPTLGPQGPPMQVVVRIPPSLPSCIHTWPISPDTRPQQPRPCLYPTRSWRTTSPGY